MADIIRVALFDDSKVIRDSLGTLLSTTPGIGLCGCYPNAEQLLERIATCKPDVVLMDIDMPGINGIEAMRLLHAQDPKLPVIMLTVFADEDRVFAALCAGAMGYLLKNTDPNELLDAIAEVRQGGAPMTPSIARKVMLHFQRLPAPPTAPVEDPGLSPREMEVLQELVAGLSYKMIADKLSISFETVRSHVKNVYVKLHVHNCAEAIAKTLKGGLLR
ncbi:MAG: response regulator transcription factor [Flavobacteriales bacterium]|jgi:DNA-binding NarL/FixJ family response regulator|nr:response regulator transcription factor [Flavobacteriales bacterium]